MVSPSSSKQDCTMHSTSEQPLNPNAEPFRLQPKQQFFVPHPNDYFHHYFYYYYVHPCSYRFYPPMKNDATSYPKMKPGSFRKRVSAKGKWRCHSNTGERVKGAKEKEKKVLEGCRASRATVIPFPSTVEEAEASCITTVMIRNNKSLGDPDDWSRFDFVYLPMDYRKHVYEEKLSNLGYAFVNFNTPAAAFNFYQNFQGLKWSVADNKKICEICVAQYQGKDVLKRIFEQKIFRCDRRDFLPVVFSEGRDGLNRRIQGSYGFLCFHYPPEIDRVTIQGELETWVSDHF
ncbi:hypothetical protein RJT34_12158 [Clitoria ternatea]|uniref:Mei2-like C-terminal RNA recognition motif domain-containing protein n=1 Tax=Clitoria ternatea TaxID=43366 RepID=A0AAN9JNX6_CLITE